MEIRKNKQLKKQHIIQLFSGVLIIILLNLLSTFVFTRIDLTSDKRYTLSDETIKILKNLDDVVYFKVYLEGEFPSGLNELNRSIKETLDEFKVYAGENIQYSFIDPFKSDNEEANKNIYEQLVKKGLKPIPLNIKEKDGSKNQVVFPSAIATYNDRDIAVNFLQEQLGANSNIIINNSVQMIEYELANSIKKLQTVIKPRIAFLTGHGELSELETYSIAATLSENYELRRVILNEKLNSLASINAKCLVIAKPDSFFTPKDQFIIDQFIMNGGKVVWLVDGVYVTMDSLQNSPYTQALPIDLGLDEMLFKYGVRINKNLIMDVNSAYIPINVSPIGAQPKFQPFKWFYFPLITSENNHVITKNLSPIRCEFASSIDTIITEDGIKKTILLTSSNYTKLQGPLEKISLAIIDQKPNPREYLFANKPIAVLLEGVFPSAFANRVSPEFEYNDTIMNRQLFKKVSKETKMIVISDGDIIKNQIHQGSQRAFPLGYDKYSGEFFGNEKFLLNAINYIMEGEEGLISLRNRELTLRLLNTTKINNERLKWQIINTVYPIILIIVIGVLFNFYKKRKYSK